MRKSLKTISKAVMIVGFLLCAYLLETNQNNGFFHLSEIADAAKSEKLASGKVIEASTNYLKPGQNKRLMLMELGSTTCVPCKMMTPILEELAKELKGKVDVQFVDVYKCQALSREFQIAAIPTQIFFDAKGKEVFRHQGFYPKAEILKKFKEFGLK